MMKQLQTFLKYTATYISLLHFKLFYTLGETSLMEVTNCGAHQHKYTYTEEKLCFIQIHVNPKLNLTRLIAIYKTHPHYPTACISSRTKCGLKGFVDLPPRAPRRLLDYRDEPSAAEQYDG